MPHLTGDPLLCMTASQSRVYKAYGSLPVWLDSHGALQCTYCNSGDEGCLDSCLLSGVMNKMRSDVRFLDAQESRKGVPVTHEEMASNFSSFCHSPDVQLIVNGDMLYSDFIHAHKIILELQSLSPWLRVETNRYAEAGGVHQQCKDRLSLKCERALALFLTLDLIAMSEEDTIILCNVVETSGFYCLDASRQGSIQKLLDLLSVVNAVKEQQRLSEVSIFQQLQDAEEQEKLLPPQIPLPPQEVSLATDDASQTSIISDFQNSEQTPKPQPPQRQPHTVNGSQPPLKPQIEAHRAAPPSSSSSPAESSSSMQSSRSSGVVKSHRAREPQKFVFSKQSRDFLHYDEEFEDDPGQPNRCRGRTKAGARCKLTEDSIGKLHGRCAEAAEPLARGAKYCKFHRDQEPLF